MTTGCRAAPTTTTSWPGTRWTQTAGAASTGRKSSGADGPWPSR
jgi:hypothetical protein